MGGPGGLRRRLARRVLPLYLDLAARTHALDTLFLELTWRCNLACRHCGSDCVARPGVPDLPFDQAVAVLEDVRTRHAPRDVTVVLSGGEPLCYPRVFDLGRRAWELGFPWGMVTNGFAWNDRAFHLAREARMTALTVSVDGLVASHDWFRGREGSHRAALRTVQRWVREAVALDVVTCVHPRNLPELEALGRLLVDLGVRRWRVFGVSPIGRAAEQPELRLGPDEARRLMDFVLAERARGAIALEVAEMGWLGPALEGRVRDRTYACRAGVNIAGMMVDGTILACPNLDRRLGQGNVRTHRFTTVWEEGFRPFRDRRWMKTGRCGSCDQWACCRGGPLHLWDLDAACSRLCPVEDLKLQSS